MNKYKHTPIIPPVGSSDNVRNLVMQLNSLFDDVYIRLGRLQKEADAIRAQIDEGDGTEDVNENDEL